MKTLRLIAGAALAAALLTACDGASLKTIIQGLVVREQLGLIEEIPINSANDYVMMGDPITDVKESLSYSFVISKYETTNAQFAKFIEDGGYTTQSYWTTYGWANGPSMLITQPFYWTSPAYNGTDQPVVGVSWWEAVAFCNWRSVKENLAPAYDKNGKIVDGANGYRLPTEVEWEYAASKGSPGAVERLYSYGDTYTPNYQVDNWLALAAPAKVGSIPAGDTREGVSDMVGNAAEWCSDEDDFTPFTPSTDWYRFQDDSGGHNFIVRGGSYTSNSSMETAYYRPSEYPGSQADTIGFRVVRRP